MRCLLLLCGVYMYMLALSPDSPVCFNAHIEKIGEPGDEPMYMLLAHLSQIPIVCTFDLARYCVAVGYQNA